MQKNFDYYRNSLTIKEENGEKKLIKLEKFDRNSLFIDQSKYFFSKINNFKKKESLTNIKESELIIKICN